MGDLDYNQIIPNQLHDVADDTVVPNGTENRANHDIENIVHIVNGSKRTEEQKDKAVTIDTEECQSGKVFVRRIKQRWDDEYPSFPRTAQNLTDNAKRFRKKGFGRHVT